MERWKTCREFPNYDVSDHGRIRNNNTGYILNPSLDANGIQRVTLLYNGFRKYKHVHNLVAEAFVPGETEYSMVVHKDDDQTNCYANNLKWVERGERYRYFYDSGKCNNNHFKKRVRCVETGEIFESITECSEITGLNYRVISRCVNNPVTRTRDGLHFRFVD